MFRFRLCHTFFPDFVWAWIYPPLVVPRGVCPVSPPPRCAQRPGSRPHRCRGPPRRAAGLPGGPIPTSSSSKLSPTTRAPSGGLPSRPTAPGREGVEREGGGGVWLVPSSPGMGSTQPWKALLKRRGEGVAQSSSWRNQRPGYSSSGRFPWLWFSNATLGSSELLGAHRSLRLEWVPSQERQGLGPRRSGPVPPLPCPAVPLTHHSHHRTPPPRGVVAEGRGVADLRVGLKRRCSRTRKSQNYESFL